MKRVACWLIVLYQHVSKASPEFTKFNYVYNKISFREALTANISRYLLANIRVTYGSAEYFSFVIYIIIVRSLHELTLVKTRVSNWVRAATKSRKIICIKRNIKIFIDK